MAAFGGTTPAVATALYAVRPLLPFGFVSFVACLSFAAMSALPMPGVAASPEPLAHQNARGANYDATAREDDPFLEPTKPPTQAPRGLITKRAAERATAPSWAEGLDDD